MQDRYRELRHELDANRLIETARETAGLSDFGDDHFREPLDKLLDCLSRGVGFHEQGLEGFKGDVVRWLVNRLRMQDDIRRYPEILREDVSDPIIITGLGRSGTTKLHKILSTSDHVQKTLFWRLWNPARFPGSKSGGMDPRIAAAGTAHLISDDKPDIDAAHHIEEQEVEEEWILYLATFEDWAWCQQFHIPDYFDWVMARPGIAPYRYVKTILQYLQWQDGGKRGRPWVMKTIGYIAHMDSLLDCYPDATLVHTHRDPRETIASFAKFMSGMWRIHADNIDPHVLGREILRTWSIAMRRYLETRDRLGLDNRILDVNYEQVRNDPVSIAREVYRRANRELGAEEERRMADWHGRNEQHRYGRHEYTLEESGLDNAGIDEAFADYIRRFIDR